MSKIEITGKQEDVIYKYKTFIQEFERIQGMYYDQLVEELKELGLDNEDFDTVETNLFDYIFNVESNETFEEYLSRYTKVEQE